MALYGLGRVAIAEGKMVEAQRQGTQSLLIFEQIGHGVKGWLARLR